MAKMLLLYSQTTKKTRIECGSLYETNASSVYNVFLDGGFAICQKRFLKEINRYPMLKSKENISVDIQESLRIDLIALTELNSC